MVDQTFGALTTSCITEHKLRCLMSLVVKKWP